MREGSGMVRWIIKGFVLVLFLAIAVPLTAYWTMWFVRQAEYDHCIYRAKRARIFAPRMCVDFGGTK